MQLKMWMVDVAREQSPSLDHLREMCRLSLEAGFNAIGLYLEHRFAYPSTPWSHGVECVTPAMIQDLEQEFPDLQIIPFINLLGHFEGMIYSEEGKFAREAMFEGLQACPSCPEFIQLCKQLIQDTCAAFKSEIIHIGGDETQQLGVCAKCQERMKGHEDGKAFLYGEHFGPLAELVVQNGRRPAVWGDMYAEHPTALSTMPKSTLIFEWQYFSGVRDHVATFVEQGFEVVGAPAIQTYNASWCHLGPSERNVREVTSDVEELGLHGVCVTTWECGLMGSYDTLLPAIRACGAILNGRETSFLGEYAKVSERHGEWARLMSEALGECGGVFTSGRIRSSLKVRLLLQANPFLCWMHHHHELCGEVGTQALLVLDQAWSVAPGEAEKGITFFVRSCIDFVRLADAAAHHYANLQPEAAITQLSQTRRMFDDLGRVAKRTHERTGGSLADIERCRIAREHVERVIARIRAYGNRQLGYLPSFEMITHPKFCPHDQAGWWLINKWANQ